MKKGYFVLINIKTKSTRFEVNKNIRVVVHEFKQKVCMRTSET